MSFRFAHMADSHLGAFRDPVLRELNLGAFLDALDVVVEEGCEFLVIAGDMFDTNLPDMDVVERAADGLRRLGEKGVRIYAFYGSHDRSPTEKGIVDVLESAGLFVNVGVLDGEEGTEVPTPPLFKDEATGTVITAIGGRRLSLERERFETMDWRPLEKAIEGAPLAVFGYHGPVEGMLPTDLRLPEVVDRKRLPRGFHYYALGHIHSLAVLGVPDGGVAAYPGPTFGGTFSDLADGRAKGLLIVQVDEEGKCDPRHVSLDRMPIETIDVDVAGETAVDVRTVLFDRVGALDPTDRIVLLRVHGTLSFGRPADLGLGEARDQLLRDGGRAVFVNRSGLRKAQASGLGGEGQGPLSGATREEIEEDALTRSLADHASPLEWLKGGEGIALARELLKVVREDPGEMPAAKYTKRVLDAARQVLDLGDRPGTLEEPNTEASDDPGSTTLDSFEGGDDP